MYGYEWKWKSLSHVRLFETPWVYSPWNSPCQNTRVHQFSSVTQLCPTLCDPMNCSMPGLPAHHQLLEFTQTHVHGVSDAIQPSHPLSSPSPPVPSPSHIRVFSNESTLRMRWPKYWSFSFSIIPSKEHPGMISFRMDWLDLLAVQLFPSPRDLPNPGVKPGLLHHRQILYQLSHWVSPRILGWVDYFFSSGSSWPRNQTGVSCISGRFFTSWATVGP